MITKDKLYKTVNAPDQKKDSSFPAYHDPTSKRYKMQHKRLSMIVDNVIGPKVLDAGCGRGLTCLLLSKRDDIKEIHGVDLQKAVLKDARENVKSHKATFHNGFVEDLEFEQESFDTVILTEVLEHVYDVDKTLKGLDAVLKSGGCVIISCPFKGKLSTLHVRSIDLDFIKKEVGKYFKIKKLEVIKYEGVGPRSIFCVGVK